MGGDGLYDPADLVIVGEDGEVRDITSPKDLRLLPERVRRCIVGWSWDRKGNFTSSWPQRRRIWN